MSLTAIANVCLPNVLSFLPKRHLFDLLFVCKQFKDLYSSSVIISTLRNILKQNTHFNTFDTTSFPLKRLMKMSKFSSPQELGIKPYLYDYLDGDCDHLKMEVIHDLDVKEIQTFNFFEIVYNHNVLSENCFVVTSDGKLFLVDKFDVSKCPGMLKRKQIILPFNVSQICFSDTFTLILSTTGEVYTSRSTIPENPSLVEGIPSIQKLYQNSQTLSLLDFSDKVWMVTHVEDNKFSVKVIDGLHNVVKMVAGYKNFLALTNDGNVYEFDVNYETPKRIQTNSFIVDIFIIERNYMKSQDFILMNEDQSVDQYSFSNPDYIERLDGKPTCLLIFMDDRRIIFETFDDNDQEYEDTLLWKVGGRSLKVTHNTYLDIILLFDYPNYWMENIGKQSEWDEEKQQKYSEIVKECYDEYFEKQARKYKHRF